MHCEKVTQGQLGCTVKKLLREIKRHCEKILRDNYLLGSSVKKLLGDN